MVIDGGGGDGGGRGSGLPSAISGAPRYLTMPMGSSESYLGTSVAAGTGLGGWGGGAEEDMCSERESPESRRGWSVVCVARG